MTAAIEHTPTARGASLEDVVALIPTLESLAAAKRAAIKALDEEDAANFLEADSAASAARLAKRAAIESELRQVENRIRGAERQRTHLEQVAVCRGVLAQHRDIDARIDRMQEKVRAVDMHIANVVKGVAELMHEGRLILQAMRSTRGRSTLTDDGYVSSADISELQSAEHWKFLVERHIAGEIPAWRTDSGPGPAFIDAAGGHLDLVRQSIDLLFGADNFPAEVVAEASISSIKER